MVIPFDGRWTKNNIDSFPSDDAPQKRSRTSRDTLRSVRKLASEPATREVTPINVLRMNSVPLKKRKVFDGVQVPTLREVPRPKMVQRAETSRNTLSIGQDLVFIPQIPSSCGAQRKRKTPPSTLPLPVGSDEEDLDWENFRVGATSSGKCNFCIELDTH